MSGLQVDMEIVLFATLDQVIQPATNPPICTSTSSHLSLSFWMYVYVRLRNFDFQWVWVHSLANRGVCFFRSMCLWPWIDVSHFMGLNLKLRHWDHLRVSLDFHSRQGVWILSLSGAEAISAPYCPFLHPQAVVVEQLLQWSDRKQGHRSGGKELPQQLIGPWSNERISPLKDLQESACSTGQGRERDSSNLGQSLFLLTTATSWLSLVNVLKWAPGTDPV